MVRNQCLHHEAVFTDIKNRIAHLTAEAEPRWGRMNAAQMLCHCELILQVSLGNIVLPKKNIFILSIGVLAKREMKLFGNGIPHNMPTFDILKVNHACDFEVSKEKLLATLESFFCECNAGRLVEHHRLFGKMSQYDWGFLHYKHLDHHLKQFGV